MKTAIRTLALAIICCGAGCNGKSHTADDVDSGRAGRGETARCGDGVTEGAEECDAAGKETWECDLSCHRTRLYTACSEESDCRDGQSCTNGGCTEICTQQANGAFACPSSDIPERALGVVCYLETEPFDQGYCRPKCRSDSDCPSGLQCADNVCQQESADEVVSK